MIKLLDQDIKTVMTVFCMLKKLEGRLNIKKRFIICNKTQIKLLKIKTILSEIYLSSIYMPDELRGKTLQKKKINEPADIAIETIQNKMQRK